MNPTAFNAGVVAVALVLGGCQYLPDYALLQDEENEAEVDVVCGGEPSFVEGACLLPDWVAFGLASQRGDHHWRRDKLQELEGRQGIDVSERELVRAVALAWGTERQWAQASELYRAHIDQAPADLQPLLRYWLNELEGRRAMASQTERSRSQLSALQQEKAELAEKLEALTTIEQNINLRQQSP
ncbi:hypothetical protein [Halomonas sp. E19]|uniref:hypothetical protein n=1 Tax=Halomonas sp. E19 TaxID=3397247 RepID=UPI0040338F96